MPEVSTRLFCSWTVLPAGAAFRSRTQRQVVGSAPIPGNHDRLGGLVFHSNRGEEPSGIFHHAVAIPEGVGTVDNPRRLGAGGTAAGNFCCGCFCQTDYGLQKSRRRCVWKVPPVSVKIRAGAHKWRFRCSHW